MAQSRRTSARRFGADSPAAARVAGGRSASARPAGGAGAKVMAVILTLLAVFSAIPVASARPSWWLLWTVNVAALSLFWLWRESRRQKQTGQLHSAIWGYRRLIAIAFVVPAYGVLQSLPIARYLPDVILTVPQALGDVTFPAMSWMPQASFLAALRLAGFLIFLMLVVDVATRRMRVQMMTRILFWGVVAQALWGLVALRLLDDFSLFGAKTDYIGVVTGTFVNRNSLATFLGFGLVLGSVLIGSRFVTQDDIVMRVSRPLRWWEKLGTESVFVGIGMLLILLALIETQSRLGLAASLIGLFVTTVLMWSRMAGFGLRHIVISLCGLVAIGVVGLVIGADGLGTRSLFVSRDGDTRWNLYLQVWEMVRMRPLTGFGLDTFGASFEAFRAPPLNSQAYYNLAHNSYLTLWSEMGIVIGSIPPILFLAVAIILWRKLRHGFDFTAQAAGALGVLVLGGIHSLGDFSLEMPANNYMFLAIIGLGLGVRRTTRRAVQAAAPVVPASRESGVTLAVVGAQGR